jgi:hypothetical protein
MRTTPVLAAFALWAVSASLAHADVTSPHPGMLLVRHDNSAMVIANLCAPGVGIRATAYDERMRTPQQFGELVNAQAAINADFFDFPGWSYVLVRARGNGQEWPSSAEQLQQPSAYWEFGNGVSNLQPNSLVDPGPGISEVVGAYDPLISNGQPVSQDNPFMQELHRRSAIGLSADRSWVYFYASNAAVNGNGMIYDMITMAAEAGAPPIGEATNQDGGGSSQLYVQGVGQVIDSGRQVNTSLAIYAWGAGGSPNCPNRPPVGTLDQAACDGINGWAQDPELPNAGLNVFLSFNGPVFGAQATGETISSATHRDDLCGPLGSCDHAFHILPPPGLLDNAPHEVHAYGFDGVPGGPAAELAQSPQTFTCGPIAVSGAKRWIPNPDVFGAWKFSSVLDIMHVSDDTLATLTTGQQIPDAPQLIQADDGSPEVWLVDGDHKRWIPDPDAANAWHFDLGSRVMTPAADVQAMPTGAPLAERPVLVQGSGPEVYVVDVADPMNPDGGGSSGDNSATGGCQSSTPSGGTGLLVIAVLAALYRWPRARSARQSAGVDPVHRRNARANARPSE